MNICIKKCLLQQLLILTCSLYLLKYLVYDSYITIGLKMWQRNAVHKVGKPSAFYLELVKFYQ